MSSSACLLRLASSTASRRLQAAASSSSAQNVFLGRRFHSYHQHDTHRQLLDAALRQHSLKDLSSPPKKLSTAEAAIEEFVHSGDKLYIHMGAASPTRLLDALVKNTSKTNITAYHMSLEGPAPHVSPSASDRIRSNSFFVGHNVRDAVNQGRADFTPVFFSEVPVLFRNKTIPLDVALIQVSPPDQHGFCSMGLSVACCLSAVQNAKRVIAMVNENFPRTHGDGVLHINHFDAIVEANDALHEISYKGADESDEKIAANVASLIPDGATLQMGIGSIPNAVLQQLGNHKNLGIHTEMFSDGLIPLLESGVVNNSLKQIHARKTVATFLMGSRRLYDFVDDNPSIFVGDVQYVNFPIVIMRNPKVHAINSAIEVDITGQVCADSIGTKMFSGIGGQMDFMRAAALSDRGKPIIALPSTTSKGESRIVPFLKQGAGVVTTRAHVHYVVTEYGIAHLHGKSIRERAMAMVAVAHPNQRESMTHHIYERFGKSQWTHFTPVKKE